VRRGKTTLAEELLLERAGLRHALLRDGRDRAHRSSRLAPPRSATGRDGVVAVSEVPVRALGKDCSRGVPSDGGSVEVREVRHRGLVSEGGRGVV
jgi:hypothetical protein